MSMWYNYYYMNIINNVKNSLRRFLYSPAYVLICAIITYFSWMTGNSLLGMALLMLIVTIVLIISQDILPILPCLFFIILTTSNDDILNQDKTWPTMIVLAILLVGGFISHIISYPAKFKFFKLTIPFIAISIALFMGGIGFLSLKQYATGLIFILSLGPCMLLIYYLVLAYTNPPEDIDIKQYICMIMLVLGFLIASQMLTYMIRSGKPLVELLRSDILNIGWTNRDGMAALFVLVPPCCFYMAFKNKPFAWFYYAIGLVVFGLVFLTTCRSAIVAVVIMMPVLIIYSMIKGANRSQLVIVICVFAILGSIFVLLKTDMIVSIIDKLTSASFSTSGRTDLYTEAIANFIKNPMFGNGLGYVGSNWDVPGFCIYWYHSNIFQIIGSMGIVGIIAYTYYYFARAKVMFSNLKRFNMALSFGIITFEIHCILNPETFIPFPFMMIVIVLTAILEYNNAKESTTFMKSVNVTNDI